MAKKKEEKAAAGKASGKKEDADKAAEEKNKKAEKEEKAKHAKKEAREKTEKSHEETKEKHAKKEEAEEKTGKDQKEGKKEKPFEENEEEEKEEPKKIHRESEEKPRKRKPKKPKKVYAEKAPKDLVKTILQLANEGKTASEIGIILKDQHNIGSAHKLTGKKVTQILKENNLEPKIPEDLMSLIRKSVNLREHMEKNKKDMSAKRGLMLTVSKIRALEKYYKKQGKLPLAWRYSAEKAALLAK